MTDDLKKIKKTLLNFYNKIKVSIPKEKDKNKKERDIDEEEEEEKAFQEHLESLPIITIIDYIINSFDVAIKYYAEKEIKEFLSQDDDNPNYSTRSETLLRKYEGNIRQHISVNNLFF